MGPDKITSEKVSGERKKSDEEQILQNNRIEALRPMREVGWEPEWCNKAAKGGVQGQEARDTPEG